jgi:hypothetical protein
LRFAFPLRLSGFARFNLIDRALELNPVAAMAIVISASGGQKASFYD